MNCRLCNEKIPRMRALFKKSEFCCDEHAELHKEQTLKRLLAESEHPADSVAPLPLPAPDDRLLASLESRTPLLDDQIPHGGPRRLAPPQPLLPGAGEHSVFTDLLNRLPAKKPADPLSGNIGGWDEAGGEDPLEALLRLESAATAPPGGASDSRDSRPSVFDSGAGAASSSEDDAILALRRLAEEARHSAQEKRSPTSDEDAEGENPFARVAAGGWDAPETSSTEDDWADEAIGQITAGEADNDSLGNEYHPEGLEGEDGRTDGDTAAGLSMFDRLVRNFNSDTGPTPGESVEPPVFPLPAASRPTAAEREGSKRSQESEEVDAPFAGSMFDRLMSDEPRPKPAATIKRAPADSTQSVAADSEAVRGRVESIELPTAEADPGNLVERERNLPGALPAGAVATEDDRKPPRPETGPVREPRPVTRSGSRKAAPIAARTELLELASSGWPAGNGSAGDSDSIERFFSEQRANEAAHGSANSPNVIEPSQIDVPVRGTTRAWASRTFGKGGAIPSWERLQPAEIGAHGGEAIEAIGLKQAAGPAREPLAPLQQPRTLGRPAPSGPSPERFRVLSLDGRTVAIESPKPGEFPPPESSCPTLDCLPSREWRPEPTPRREPDAAVRRGGHWQARLELANALPASQLGAAPSLVTHDPLALPLRVPVRLPGTEQHGDCASTDAGSLPGAVAGLVGAEPEGTPFETANLELTRRLVAKHTSTEVGESGGAASEWSPSLASEPYYPVRSLENGDRA